MDLEMDVEEEIFLPDLPRELLEMIFSQLDALSQQRIRRVCALWDELITDPYGDCRHQVHFELSSGGRIAPREKIFDESPQQAFALCVGRETRDVVFFQPHDGPHLVSSSWPSANCRYLYLTIALRMRLQTIQSEGYPVVLRRLIFANLPLTAAALARMILCSPEMVREVWLRRVTLVAPLELSGPFCMAIADVNKRYDTLDVESFQGRGTEDYGWAKFVAECGGPLSASEEQLVLESLRNETLAQKLSEELQDGDVAETFNDYFWGEFESMDAKNITLQWLRKFDVWTLRFLYHYFVSVCNVQPM